MFRFEEPAYLYLLLLLPFLAAFYLYSNYRRRRNIRRFGDPELLAQLMPDVSKYRPDVKFWLIFAAIGLFSVLLARPQFGSKQETVKRKGVEVIIALDISNSMLAQDVQPSRLEKAKRLISRLVDELDNDKVGMIVFAGDAFTQLPITSDYISAKMFLESISPSLISKQGTAISADQMQPGDLLFYSGGSGINHVAMYIGDGKIVHASTYATGIKISKWNYRNPVKIISMF